VEEGEFFGLLGPNGAGKTTLINVIAGLARADAGFARVMGADVVADYRRARRMLGVVPQELVFDPFFTVRETLRLQSGYFGIRRNDAWIDEVMQHLDLAAKADVNMRSLSGGMKRRVLVAQALVHKPPVIILDEPTAGVDVELRQGLWQFVRRLNRDGHTIVLTTHYLEEAEQHCNRIAMLKSGRIAALDNRNYNDFNKERTAFFYLFECEEDRPAAQAAFAIQARNLARLAGEGVEIALGTDGNIPWSAHLEMADMVAAGMTPAEVIVAATSNAAEFLGLEDAGTVTAGKSADFIVLEANPLDDITNTRRIRSVYLRGTEVERDVYN